MEERTSPSRKKSFSCRGNDFGELHDIKVQQDLLRHSSARLTLDTYTQSVTTAKREAKTLSFDFW